MELHTPRLVLEPLEPRHASVLFEELQSPLLYEFTEDEPPRSVEALRDRYTALARRRSPDGAETWLNWVVRALPEKRYAGYVQATIAEGGSAFIAYVFFTGFRGKGYAREAAQRMLDHLGASYNCHEFRASVDERNHRSIALLEYSGFVRVAVRKTPTPIKGVSSDEFEYCKTLPVRT
jgi:RimJ/RimL family protein N-acetyltransferase